MCLEALTKQQQPSQPDWFNSDDDQPDFSYVRELSDAELEAKLSSLDTEMDRCGIVDLSIVHLIIGSLQRD